MRYDLWKICAVLAVAALIGFLAGYMLQATLIASLLLFGWYLYRLDLLLRWIRNPSNEPLPESNGLFYLIHREISRRNANYRDQKRQLTRYLAQFRKAATVIPDAIVLIDQAGKIEWANTNARTLLSIEWPRDARVRFSDLVRNPQCTDLLSDPEAGAGSLEISLPKSRDQTLSLSCARYTEKLRMITVRDISHLVKVNKMHRNFVANVSHELKTPLTVLKGYLEIMSHHPDLPAGLRKPVDQMSIQSARMQLLVEDLLYLAKLEDRFNLSEHDPVEVTPLVNAILESIQPTIERKRHKIQLEIDHKLLILGNPNELHSAFSNLISNAVNYTDANGVVTVSWKGDANGAEFMVKDTGVGIEASALPNLTRRFYRVDDGRSRDSGGTGLGLAITKHVLQRHNAELEINSLIGVGSEFRCLFPAQQVISNQDQAQRNTG